MNKQRVFDEVLSHAKTQNAKSVNKEGKQCEYRRKNGMRCFIGALIPDKDYRAEFEGHPVSNEYIEDALPGYAKPLNGEERALLTSLQRIHDNVYVKKWAQELIRIADDYGLTCTLKVN